MSDDDYLDALLAKARKDTPTIANEEAYEDAILRLRAENELLRDALKRIEQLEEDVRWLKTEHAWDHREN